MSIGYLPSALLGLEAPLSPGSKCSGSRSSQGLPTLEGMCPGLVLWTEQIQKPNLPLLVALLACLPTSGTLAPS